METRGWKVAAGPEFERGRDRTSERGRIASSAMIPGAVAGRHPPLEELPFHGIAREGRGGLEVRARDRGSSAAKLQFAERSEIERIGRKAIMIDNGVDLLQPALR